jgi:hypothetical protein
LLSFGNAFYWGLGGKWGAEAAVPTKENDKKVMNPNGVDCFVVGLGLLSFAVMVLARAQILSFDLPAWLIKCGSWAISAIFILRAIGEFHYVGFFKKVKSTRFARYDTKYYSPLCLAIGILTAVLAIAG